MSSLIWQPRFENGLGFSVDVDSALVRLALTTKLANSLRTKMQQLPVNLRFTSNQESYGFVNDTAMVRQISLGSGGRWLYASTHELECIVEGEPLTFYSHNIDSPSDALTLLRLIDLWARYVPMLNEESLRK